MHKFADGTGTLTQSSANMTTPPIIGENYRYSFWVYAVAGGAPTSGTFTIGGKTITVTDPGNYLGYFTATSTDGWVYTPDNTSRFMLDTVSLRKQRGVIRGSAILATGTMGLTPPSGAGTRFMWIPSLNGGYVFRAGQVSGTQWDEANLAQLSFGVGIDILQAAMTAVVAYKDTVAENICMAAGGVYVGGDFNVAGGSGGVFLGNKITQVTGTQNIGIGSTLNFGSYSAVSLLGQSLVAGGDNQFNIGNNFTNSTASSVAFGVGGVDLLIAGGITNTKNIYPLTDNTYYLGKNDDDSPLAFKGVILKDTTDGKYYRIEVISGVVTATDLTD
jgi:hypothetical protein